MGRVGEYEVLETLGQGAYSKVKRVLHIPTGELFVAKIIAKTNQRVAVDVRLEISILRRLKHRNTVQLIEILESSNNYYIILEPVMGGDLCDLIMSSPDPLSEQDVAALFIQLVAGVRACHRNGVAHRDLKPENLLLTTTGVLKISDFGLSRLHHESNFQAHANEYAHTLTGTLAYVAPEVFDRTYDAFLADIWSLGCILYVLLTQNFPFGSASDPSELERRIRTGEVSALPQTISEEAKDLCMWLLSPRPVDRPSLDQVAQHAFFAANLPRDYLAFSDGRRPQVVQGANADEFSSRVQDEQMMQEESSMIASNSTNNNTNSSSNTTATLHEAGSPDTPSVTPAADPTPVHDEAASSDCSSQRRHPRTGSSDGQVLTTSPAIHNEIALEVGGGDEMSSLERAGLRRARPYVR